MRNLLRIIHTGKSHLGWDDETYRSVLKKVTGNTSAKDCTKDQLDDVVRYMRKQGFKPINRRPSVAKDKTTILKKIEALLLEADRTWKYAEGLAVKMFNRQRIEFLDYNELVKLMKALLVDAKRHGRTV